MSLRELVKVHHARIEQGTFGHNVGNYFDPYQGPIVPNYLFSGSPEGEVAASRNPDSVSLSA